ncbi:hypothetical protein PFISCL1PPCAC_24901, partial [Pristionchus fissidentatus]
HRSSAMEVEEHQCDMCDKRFDSAAKLDRHMPIHSNERPFVCPVCPLRFKWENSLKCHREKHRMRNRRNAFWGLMAPAA